MRNGYQERHRGHCNMVGAINSSAALQLAMPLKLLQSWQVWPQLVETIMEDAADAAATAGNSAFPAATAVAKGSSSTRKKI